jgi:hypothetical protein
VNDQQVTTNNQLSSNTQQHYILQKRGINKTKPRKQFIEDFCQQFQDISNNIINFFLLGMDANEN